MRSGFMWAAVAAAGLGSLASGLPVLADGVGVPVVNGDKITAAIDVAGEDDAFAMDLHEGGQLFCNVKASKGSAAQLTLRLFRPDGSEASPGATLTGSGSSKVALKKFVIAEGGSGTWVLRISGSGAATGSYDAQFKAKPPKKVTAAGPVVPAGGSLNIPFGFEEGASLKASVKAGKGEPALSDVQFLPPEDTQETDWTVSLVAKGTAHTLSLTPKSATPANAGQALLRLVNEGASDIHPKVSLSLKFAKAAKRKAVLPPEARIDSVGPTVVRQSSSGSPLGTQLTLSGANFLTGSVIRLDGDESLGSTSIPNSGTATVTVSVPEDAPFGPRDLLFCPPALQGEPVALPDAFTVLAPVPTASGLSPTSVKQGQTAVLLTVTGTGFREGGVLSIDGTGITAGPTTILSATQARLTMNIAADATVGLRSVTYTQPEEGGGDAVTLTDALTVLHPDPTLTAINPTTVVQGNPAVTFTLTGTGFRDGGVVSLGGDISVSGATRKSDTQYEVTLSVHGQAILGLRSVTYTQPAAGGGASATLNAALQVNTPNPSITGASGATLLQGETGHSFSLFGSNFRDGGVLAISGTGLTVGGTTIVSSTHARVDVDIAADATVGARTVTYTQPAAGGGQSVNSASLVLVNHPDPTITNVTPTILERGTVNGNFTVTGTGFRTGGALTLSGSGATLSNVTVDSANQVSAKYSVDGAASLGKRSVTWTQPVAGGGASTTATDAVEVFPVGPELTAVTPSSWTPGKAKFNVVLTGVNFVSGTTVAVSGSGVTLHSTTIDSTTKITLNVSVDPAATLGTRDLTITPGAGGGAQKVFDDVLAIAPLPPAPATFSAAALGRSASGVAVTVKGTGFRSGDVLSSSGADVTFSSVTIVDTETITASVAVGSSAALGLRDLVVTRSSTLGGAAGTLEDAFTVVLGTPTVSSVSPAILGRTGSGGATRDFTVIVTGSNFSSGATLAASKTSGSGVSVKSSSEEVLSSTSLRAVLTITGTASTGTWNLQVTNPGGGNGTGTNILDIKSETTVAVNAVSPSSGDAHGGEQVTIYGSGFAVGAKVEFGTVAAGGTQRIDGSTLVTTVPVPAGLSKTADTSVTVKVTNPDASNASLANGWTYGSDSGDPYLLSTFPVEGASGVATNLKKYVFILSEPMDASSFSASDFDFFGNSVNDVTSPRILSFAAPSGSTLVVIERGVVSGGGSNTPNLAKSSQYAADINSGALDLAGNAFTPLPHYSGPIYRGFFTTGTTTDTTAPTLSTVTPASSATGQSVTTAVTLVFSEEIDPATVDLTNITFKQSSTTIPATILQGTDLKTVTITPQGSLTASTTYTTTITTAVKDLCGNAVASSIVRTFTTGSSDGVAPTIDAVVIEDLPADMDGSTTYVAGDDTNSQGQLLSAGSATAFDLYLPRNGWKVEVQWSDQGGAGVDTTTFSAKANVAVGSASANDELASNFTITPTGATWVVPSTGTVPGFTSGDNATFTFLVKDKSANTSSSMVVTIDVIDKDATATGSSSKGGTSGGDHDPFDGRRTWVFRSDLDAYSHTFTTAGGNRGATTTVSGNGIPDLDESLRLIGLNTGSMTTAAAATVNGADTGTNNIVKRLFLERLRAAMRERYHITEDGVRDGESVNVEFLLPGEQGSLGSMPTWSGSNAISSGKAYAEMSVGGTLGAENNATATAGILGQAWIDVRNTREEANLNFGVTNSITGIYLTSMLKLQVNDDTSTTIFGSRISAKFVAVKGGTPVGEDALDDDVLADAFDRTSGSNSAAQNDRYDDIMDAVELVALYTSAVMAHEVGHSQGLVPDGPPKTGLFGNAHRSNTFTEATSLNPNTSFHLNFPGNDIMAPSTSFETGITTGSDFKRFSPTDAAYLRNRLLVDEGK